MTDTSESNDAKVVSLFSGKAIGPEHVAHQQVASAPTTSPPAGKQERGVDRKSEQTLNGAIEDVLTGKCRDVCIIGTGAGGLPRFYMSFGEGVNPQVEAVRYIGHIRLFEGMLEEVVYNGVETVPDAPDRAS